MTRMCWTFGRTLAVCVAVAAPVALGLPAGVALGAEDVRPDLLKEVERGTALIAEGKVKEGNLICGDAYRGLGEYAKAVASYRAVLPNRNGLRLGDLERKALDGLDEIEKVVFAAIDNKRLTDGTFESAGAGYVGPVGVKVIVKNSRIASVQVTETKENRPRTAIQEMPKRVTHKGDVRGVDVVSGATVTSRAILKAITYALAGAVRPPDREPEAAGGGAP